MDAGEWLRNNWKKAMTILKEIVTAESKDKRKSAKETVAKASDRYMALRYGIGTTRACGNWQ